MNTTANTRTSADIRRELKEALELEKNQKAQQKEAYESLRNETIQTLCTQALEINFTLALFKENAFKSLGTVWQMLQEYSSRHSDSKGNFTIENGNFRITYRRQGRPTFDERSHQAEKHIIDFVNSKFEEDNDCLVQIKRPLG